MTASRSLVAPDLRVMSPPSAAEVDEAAGLIDDLAALVDAGLVVVRKQLGGAARYEAAAPWGEAA